MRTNVVLDGELVREAFRLTGARTKRELIDMALRELVRVRRKKNLMELAEQIRLRKDFDRKGLRALRHGPH